MPFSKSPSALRRYPLFALSTLIVGSFLTTMGPGLANTPPKEPDTFDLADSPEGNYLAAYVAGMTRDMRAAAFYYQQSVLDDPRNQELRSRAFVALIADGRFDEAFAMAKTISAKNADNKFAQFALTVRDIKLGRYGNARTYLKSGTRGDSADLTSLLLTAWSYAGSKDQKRALLMLDTINKTSPFSIVKEYHAGLIAAMSGDNAQASERLRTAYRADRTALRVIDAYGRILSQQGDRAGALDVYEGFDRRFPNHPIVTDALKRLHAGEVLPPLITSAQQGAAEVLYSLGSVGRDSGDELPSIIYLRLALYLSPEEPLTILTLSDLFERMKHFEQSIDILKTVPKASPLRVSAEVQIGFALEALKRSDEAEASLKQTMADYPNDLEAISALGSILRSRQQWSEAAEVYTKAIATIGTPTPRHWTLFFFRGTCYERAKEWKKAEADLEKAKELVPEGHRAGRAQVLNYLAYSWVDTNVNIDAAFKMLQEAVELSPQDGMIIDSLGWAYYRLGRYDEAVRELEKAVSLKPGDPVINDHLGDAYWKVGRKTEAQFQWQHAKDSKPESADLIKIENKLKNGLDAATTESDPKPEKAASTEPTAPSQKEAATQTESTPPQQDPSPAPATEAGSGAKKDESGN